MEIGVIGAGAWGTAFSVHLTRMGHKVLLWVYEADLCETLKKGRINHYYLPGVELPEAIEYTDDLKATLRYSKYIIIATPSFALRDIVAKVAGPLSEKRILILTKGLEDRTLMRMSQVVEDVLKTKWPKVAVLSGPSFAMEVAKGVFTSVVVASRDLRLAHCFQKMVHSEQFRVYTNDDIIGVELGGAMKNVMAIGAGIIEGLRLGTNIQAAFITRAIAEIKRLGRAVGAKETTFMGLSGLGDLMLTSYGGLSRNRRFGVELAAGKMPEEIIKGQKEVVEGYYTVKAAHRYSRAIKVDMPITRELYRIIYKGKDIKTSIKDITQRRYKREDS